MQKTFRFHSGQRAPGEKCGPRGARFFLVVLGCLLVVWAQPASSGPLRVGTSGDYAPFSVFQGAEGSERYQGLSPSLARAFAQHRGVEIEFVPFRWPDLLKDLASGRFDVAMSGITIRPERSLAGRFSLPITTSGAVILVPDASPFVAMRELDEETFTIAVNAGGHLERVTRKHFGQARILPMQENADVIRALAQGDVDAAITDTREATVWQRQHPGLRAIGPFTRDRKAFLVRADNPELARELDAWLLETELDGSLEALRTRELGKSPHPTVATQPLRALLAAVDERLALMPFVAEAKRSTGGPIEVPDVETRVLADAIARFRAAQAQNPAAPIREETLILDFYRAQIEAAKSIQSQILAIPSAQSKEAVPDLAGELRPALLRINDRIATLLVALPEGIDQSEVTTATEEELISTHLPPRYQAAIAQALIALTAPPNSP